MTDGTPGDDQGSPSEAVRVPLQMEAALLMPLRVRLAWDWMDTLVRTVWGEARNQSWEGKVAVACVIMNRSLATTWYGTDPKSVCLKRWQFSCWNKGDPNLQKMLNLRPGDDYPSIECEMAIYVAARIAGTDMDPSCGATHYHTRSIKPSWIEGETPLPHDDLKPCADIGDHLFYKGVD